MPASTPGPDETPAHQCTHCHRLLYAEEIGRQACRPCETTARDQLSVMVGLYEQLTLRLTPGRAAKAPGGSPTGRTAPLPVALGPLNLIGPGGMVTLLQDVEDSWRRALGRTRIEQRATDSTKGLEGVVQGLTINLLSACERYDEIADDLDTIARVYWQARNIVDGNQARVIRVRCRYLYLGEDGEPDSECGAPMAVDINRTSAKCIECGTRWGRDEWVALLKATGSLAA